MEELTTLKFKDAEINIVFDDKNLYSDFEDFLKGTIEQFKIDNKKDFKKDIEMLIDSINENFSIKKYSALLFTIIKKYSKLMLE